MNDESEHENFMLEDTLEMEQCRHWYKTELAPKLTDEEKLRLLSRINDYRLPHKPLPYKNPTSEFPEITKYTRKEFLTAPELLTVSMELYREVRETERKKEK